MMRHWVTKVSLDDLDHSLVDESEHVIVQTLSVVVGKPSLFDDHTDSTLQLVLGLVPLLLGDHHLEVGGWASSSRPRVRSSSATSALASATTITLHAADACRTSAPAPPRTGRFHREPG
jgi:hypothetical protein